MRHKYIIHSAHSGTSVSEINKAKRFYRAEANKSKTYRTYRDYPNTIVIEFKDVNNSITAYYYDEIGEGICNPCRIL